MIITLFENTKKNKQPEVTRIPSTKYQINISCYASVTAPNFSFRLFPKSITSTRRKVKHTNLICISVSIVVIVINLNTLGVFDLSSETSENYLNCSSQEIRVCLHDIIVGRWYNIPYLKSSTTFTVVSKYYWWVLKNKQHETKTSSHYTCCLLVNTN